MESNPGQCPFTLDDTFFPTDHRGKKFLDCVWMRLLPRAKRPHARKFLDCVIIYLMLDVMVLEIILLMLTDYSI